jgi:O-antigen ligase
MVPLVLELVLASLFLFRPTAAIKLMLFSAGLPLTLFYQDIGNVASGVKPLFAEWGGTTPDGLRLIFSCILLAAVLLRLEDTRALLIHFWPYTVLLLFMAGTVVHSTAPVEGIRLLMKIVFPFLLLLAVAQLLKSARDAELYADYWLAGGVIASLCAPVLVLMTGTQFLFTANEFRYNPGFTSSSSYSFYMLALFLYCYARWRKEYSIRFAALTMIFGVQTILPMTRIAWAALLLGLTAFEISYVKGRKKWLAVLVVGLAPAVLMYALVWQFPALQERVFQSDRVDSDLPAIEQAQNVGLSGRGAVWLAGWVDYQEHSLLLGQGIGSNDHYFMSLFGTVAHNEYLRILYDGGAIGLILFIFANLSLLRWLLKLRRHAPSSVRLYSGVGVALVFAYLLIAITDNPLDYYLLFTQYIFFVLGVCIALAGDVNSLGVRREIAGADLAT